MDINKYYQILGLPLNATLEDVKLAYRKLAKKFHPDLNNGDDYFNNHFLKIQEAYDFLNEHLLLLSSKLYVNSTYNPSILSFGDKFEIIIDINRKVENVYILQDDAYLKVNNTIITNVNNENFQISISNTVKSYNNQYIPQFHLRLSNGQYIVTKSLNIELLQHRKHTDSKTKNKKESLSSRLDFIFFIFIISVTLILLWNYASKDKVSSNIEINSQTISNVKSEENAIIDVDTVNNQLNNGDSPYEQYFGKSIYDKVQEGKLIIKNGEGYDAIVCLVRNDNRIIRNEYIQSGSDFTMTSIPKGIYYLKIFSGNDWNPELNLIDDIKGGFNKNQSFTVMNQTEDQIIMKDEIENDEIYYHYYEITLYPVKDGNVESEEIDMESFFNK